MPMKEKDFIEISYTGRIKEGDIVFDTTEKDIAKKEEIFNSNTEYGPIVVCLGQNHVLRGIEKNLLGKEIGEYTFELSPEDGFGKKSAKLIQLVPTRKFKAQKVIPQPGLQINVDGNMGIVKAVSGGRTIVDFNNPLSGKDLIYNVNVLRIVNEDKEKLESLIKMQIGIKNPKIEIKDGNAIVFFPQEIPKEIADPICMNLKELIGFSNVEFKKIKTDNSIKPTEPKTNL